MSDEILNATDEIITTDVNKLQHGFDRILQGNLHLMTDAGKTSLLWQLTLIENKIASLRFICERTQDYLKKYSVVKIIHIECPKCHSRDVSGLYKNDTWGMTCNRCKHVETTTDYAISQNMWVATEEIEPVIADTETITPEPETPPTARETNN